jgi:dTDP-4-amino-4,6-dideoxygalactose transaminase
MRKIAIPHSRPTLGRAEARAVLRVLRSGQIGGGREVELFEREMERFLGGGHATAVHTGTAALHLALLGLGLGPGDRVVLPSYVCAAVLHAVRYVGARPVLADVSPETGNLDPADVRRRAGRGARALVVPHMFGRRAPLEELRRLGLPIVEDCAMALGGGTGRGGDVSVFSFYATKMIATGHGGMVVARDRRVAARVRDLVSYDNRDDDRLRYNYRMSALAAALGRAQLARVPEFVKRRRRIAEYYCRALGVGRPPRDHLFYRFVLRVGPVERFVRFMAARAIECKRPVYRPLHRLWASAAGEFPGAEELHRAWASIPIYPSLGVRERRRVVEAVGAFLAQAP